MIYCHPCTFEENGKLYRHSHVPDSFKSTYGSWFEWEINDFTYNQFASFLKERCILLRKASCPRKQDEALHLFFRQGLIVKRLELDLFMFQPWENSEERFPIWCPYKFDFIEVYFDCVLHRKSIYSYSKLFKHKYIEINETSIVFGKIIDFLEINDQQELVDILVENDLAEPFLKYSDEDLQEYFNEYRKELCKSRLFRGQLRLSFGKMKAEVFKFRKRIASNKAKLEGLANKLHTHDGCMQLKSKWFGDFVQLVKAVQKDVAYEYFDPGHLQMCTIIIANTILMRGINTASRSHTSYDWKSVLRMVIDQLPGSEDKFAINFEDSQRGESESIIAIIAKAYNMPELTSQLKGFDLSINLDDKRNFEAWKMLAQVFAVNNLVPITNNGSRALIEFRDAKGNLSSICRMLDAMAEDISSAAVYLLGLINGSNENILGVKSSMHEPLNGTDSNGRKIVTVVYDSNRTDLLQDPDGSGATNFVAHENIGQTRFWMVKEADDGLKGLFAKGQQFNAKFTVVPDSKGNLRVFSVNDLVNLAELDKEKILELGYSEQEYSILEKSCDFFNPTDLYAVSRDQNLYWKLVSNRHFWQRTDCTVMELVNARLHCWDELFANDTTLPWVVGLELGQVKCRAKNEFNHVAKTEINDIKKALKASPHGVVELDGDLFGCVIIKSPSDKISKTSLNFQPMSLLVSKYCRGTSIEEVWANYCLHTDEMLESFSSSNFDEDQKSRFDRFINYLSLQNTKFHKNGKLLLKNFKASLWRWFTNFNKTYQPTRRVLMHKMSYRGFCIVDDRFDFKVGKVAQQRGPLISPLALQANVYLNRKIACNLLQKVSTSFRSETKRQKTNAIEQIALIKERIAFRNDIDEVTEDMVIKLLEEVISISTVVDITDALVLMDPKDVEDMQGDDDGDTVTVDRDPEVVAMFAATEIFWKDFFVKNGIKTIELEMPKEAQVKFRVGARYLLEMVRNQGVNVAPLTEEELQAINEYGIECPEIAKYFRIPGTKIPNILGLSFSELHELDTYTGGLFMKPENFAMIACKLGSNPAGPIGAPSNCAPDLMIKALANVDKNGILTKEGRFIFEGYKNSASQVQISIDFSKRINKINNSFLMGTEGYPDFSKQLKIEDIFDFLVVNTAPTVELLRIRSEDLNMDKTVRVFTHKSASSIASYDQWLADADPYQVYFLTPGDLKALRKFKSKTFKLKFSKVNLRDKDNYCFDFDSIYAFAGFALSIAFPGMEPAIWKTSMDEILGSKFEAVKESFAVSTPNSALVENATCFLRYYEQSDLMKELLQVTPDFIKFAKQSNIGRSVDHLYPKVSVAIAKFFAEEYSFTKKVASPRKVLNALFDAYGITDTQAGVLKTGGAISYGEMQLNIADIIVSVARNDDSYQNQDIPQTAWQMLLDEYLNPEEDSDLFKAIVPHGTESAIHNIRFLNTLPVNGNNRSMASSPKRILDHFGENLQAKLIENASIMEAGAGFKWTSPQAIFSTASMAMKKLKSESLSSFSEVIRSDELFPLVLKEVEQDPFAAVETVLSAVKAAYRKYDDIIKYLGVLGKMKVAPVCPFINSRYQKIKGEFTEPQANAVFCGMSIHQIGHSANLFATPLDPVNVLNTLSSDGFVYDPQHNRISQWQAVSYIASQGHYIKSFSYFGNSSWKDPKTVCLMDKFQKNELTLSNSTIRVETPKGNQKHILAYISEMNFLKVIGLEYSKAFKVLLKTDRKGNNFYNLEAMEANLALQSTGLSTRVVWRDSEILLPYFHSNIAWTIYSVTLSNKAIEDMSELAQNLDTALKPYGLGTEDFNLKFVKIMGRNYYSTQKIIAYFSKQLVFNK